MYLAVQNLKGRLAMVQVPFVLLAAVVAAVLGAGGAGNTLLAHAVQTLGKLPGKPAGLAMRLQVSSGCDVVAFFRSRRQP